MSESALYLRAAEALRENPGQWAAYNATGHCVVLAGPGSGKTKTLTIKLARMLAEDVEPPRGVACITYNNECARELEDRLDALGVRRQGRVFIGTVHSFALTQVILPYARVANMDLPEGFRVATQSLQKAALAAAHGRVIHRGDRPADWESPMSRYRRGIIDRDSPRWREDSELADLVEAYEGELRRRGLIDFDDMPLLAVRAFRRHPWLQRAILAKYPVLVVDEYQDLGTALHGMVMGLCFSTGVRLFAVGDIDQSIYGFTGANPELLHRLSERTDVEAVRLRMNYRSGRRIVAASVHALGETRDYEAHPSAADGAVFFHPGRGPYGDQAETLFAEVLPGAMARIPSLTPGEVAVLYPTAKIGDEVAQAAQRHGFEVVRADRNALYPRGNLLMRWLEACAGWCCQGWRTGAPRFSRLVADGARVFAEIVVSDGQRQTFQRRLMKALWSRRDAGASVHEWISGLRDEFVDGLLAACRSLDDDAAALSAFLNRTGPEGTHAGMTLGAFAGFGANDRINLSTFHSAKGREFGVTILFAVDSGQLPWSNSSAAQQREARRQFYVGFTRAKRELHIMFSERSPSPFVRELEQRLEEE